MSALWGFVLNLTVGDGAALLRADTLYQTVGVTSTDLGLQLQGERARSAIAISSRVVTSDLGVQRDATDTAVKKFRAAATSERAASSVTSELRTPLDNIYAALDRLPEIRSAIDSGRSTRLVALSEYNRILDLVFRLYDQLVALPDLSIFQQATAMQSMGNAREFIARENALMSGALIDRRMSPEEHDVFSEFVSTRRFLHSRGLSSLDAELRRPYEQALNSPSFKQFADLETRIISATGNGDLPPDAERWRATADSVSSTLDDIGLASTNVLAERSTSVAMGILLRIGIAGGLGLIAVVASIILSIRFGRRLSRELLGLRRTATELANTRLPRVVERLRRGEEVNVEEEAPPIAAGGSREIRDVAKAFSSVQRTAVEAAVGQAAMRRGVGQVFLNLARRKQSLLHRQLTLLDGMQRKTNDPADLEDLFRLDHLTTRMRRHAEGLIILSGAVPGRAWRKPVPVVDILRAAVAEVEDYTRVAVLPAPNAALDGAAVADVTHLIAELIENATVFSPPQTTVNIRGDLVANGFAIEVEDRGLGLMPEEYAAINDRLANPPEFDLADSDRLGLFVVGQLAIRHGIHVMLRASPYGGTTAIVLIPRPLVAESDVPGLIVPAAPRPIAAAPRKSERRRERRQRRAEPVPATPVPEPLSAGRPEPGDLFTPGAPPAETPPSAVRPAEDQSEAPSEVQQIPEPLPRRGSGPFTVVGDASERSKVSGTHAGLPRRVRQANLAPQLREAKEEEAEPEATDRSPDEARAIFTAFQQGSRRGREDADFAHQTNGDKREE
ncbi:nitrate- and nitrite sensing domain-containing protein [Streptosporangium sp. KLBMP 9127]|nr:nitrate- and nitrite sensing domain-containing protein [Streptosporangium sp. KLBMP 9127]